MYYNLRGIIREWISLISVASTLMKPLGTGNDSNPGCMSIYKARILINKELTNMGVADIPKT